MGTMHTIVANKDDNTLEVATTVAIWNRDPFIRVKKKTSILTMQLESIPHSDKEEDKEEISRLNSAPKLTNLSTTFIAGK